MKVYLLFCGDDYYPAGFNDYKGTFQDYDSAFNLMLKKYKSGDNFDWAEIIKVTETESQLVFSAYDIESFFEGFNNGNLER
jgi:hypothetical protein